jgi:toxin CcdB
VQQFDVFPNPIPDSKRVYPLVVCMQSDLIASGSDRVVAPLALRRNLPGATTRISPSISIGDAEYLVLVSTLMTLPAKMFPRRVANLASHREDLLCAIDLLFYGV